MCISESFYYPRMRHQMTSFHVSFKTCQSLILGRQVCQSNPDDMRLNSFFFYLPVLLWHLVSHVALANTWTPVSPSTSRAPFQSPTCYLMSWRKIWSSHLYCDVSDTLPAREEASPNRFISRRAFPGTHIHGLSISGAGGWSFAHWSNTACKVHSHAACPSAGRF